MRDAEAVKENRSRDTKAVSFRSLARIGLVLVALTIVGVYFAYAKLIHYERHALEHLPEGTEIAGRVDVERVVLFEPVRRYLLPLIDEVPLGSRVEGVAAGAPMERLVRLRQVAGLNLGFDLRELGFGVTEDGHDWVLSLGGLFPKKGLLDAIERTLREEGATRVVRTEQGLLFEPWGALLAQADDGVLVLASGREALDSALPSSPRFQKLGLPLDGPGSLAALTPWLRRIGLSMFPEDAEWLSGVGRFMVNMNVGADVRVDARLQLLSAASTDAVEAGVRRWTSENRSAGSGPKRSTNWSEEWGLMARIRDLQARGNIITFRSSWSRAELGRAARDLANWLERNISANQPSKS